MRDRLTGTTKRVGVGSGGTEGYRESFAPLISPHGRYVGFWSGASNLVVGDTNQDPDEFVRTA